MCSGPSHHQIQINTTGHEIVFASAFVHEPRLYNMPSQLLEEAVRLMPLNASHAPLRPAFEYFVLKSTVAVEQKEKEHPEADERGAL